MTHRAGRGSVRRRSGASLLAVSLTPHPGEIMLLHAVSKTNTEIPGDVIDVVRAQGYTFKLLPR